MIGRKPMIANSIEYALSDESISEVYVSTDSENISEISKTYGAKVFERAAALAGDSTLTNKFIQCHVNNFKKKHPLLMDLYFSTHKPYKAK